MDNPFVVAAGALAPIVLIFGLAIATETSIEHYGAWVPTAWKPQAALLLALVFCILYNADFFALLGFRAAVPYAGSVVTAFIVGRGSNFVNIVWKRLNLTPTPAASVDDIVDHPSKRSRRSAAEAARLSTATIAAAAPATPPAASEPTFNNGYREPHAQELIEDGRG